MTFAIPLPRRPQPIPEPLRLPHGEGRAYVSGKGIVRQFQCGEPSPQMAKTLYHAALRPNSAGDASKTAGVLGRGLWADGSSANDFWRQHQVGDTSPVTSGSTGFQRSFPISVELVFEAYSLPASSFDLVFGNGVNTGRHAGFNVHIRPSGALRLFIGDGSGNGLSDLFSWEGTANITTNTPYHVIMSAGAVGAGNGEIFINGIKDTISTTAGTASDIGYHSSGAVGFCAAGGNAALGEPFHGRVYAVAFFNRRIFETEAGVRYRRLWRGLRAPQLMVEGSGAPVSTAVASRLMSRMPWFAQ